MPYIPSMQESASGWIGNGRVVYSTGNKRNTPLADNAKLQELYKPYRDSQIQRRQSQAAQKAARKASRQGHVTVYDKAKHAHVSATPEEAKIIQAANRNLNTGSTTRNLPAIIDKPKYNYKGIFDEALNFNMNNPFTFSHNTGFGNIGSGSGSGNIGGVGASAAHTTATPNLPAVINHGTNQELQIISETVNETNKPSFWSKLKNGASGLFSKTKNAIKNGWSKVKSFFKTPKGKWGLVAAAVIAVGAALWAYVNDRFSDKNKPTPTDGPSKAFMPKLEDSTEETGDAQKVNEEDIPATNTAMPPNSEETPAENEETVTPVPAEEETQPAQENQNTNTNTPVNVSGNTYEVVKGDCVWNIAKAHLIELNKDNKNYVPSNAEILKHTNELMKINNLKFEPDNYHVMIYPKQKLKLKE